MRKTAEDMIEVLGALPLKPNWIVVRGLDGLSPTIAGKDLPGRAGSAFRFFQPPAPK
jgi:hypothetical protein